MDLYLKDKVVIVTAAQKASAKESYTAWQTEDAIVMMVNRRASKGRRSKRSCARRAKGAYIPAELTEVDECKRVIDETVALYGASMSSSTTREATTSWTSPRREEFMKGMRDNLIHYYALVHYAHDYLIKSQGSIVNIGSHVSITGQGHTSAYVAPGGHRRSDPRMGGYFCDKGVNVNSSCRVGVDHLCQMGGAAPDPKPDGARRSRHTVRPHDQGGGIRGSGGICSLVAVQTPDGRDHRMRRRIQPFGQGADGMSKKFRILVRKFGPFEQIVSDFWAQFKERSGVDMELEMLPLPLPELHAAILTGDFDVAHVNTDWLAECWSKGCLENLAPYVVSDPPEDYPEGWANALLKLQTFRDGLAGVPFHDGPECLIYRKDLFESPAEKAAFRERYGTELTVPATWEEFSRAAEFFNRPEQNMYGTVFALYPDGHNNIFDFALQVWSRGGDFVDPCGRLSLNSPEAVAAMTAYRELLAQPFIHPRSRELESIGTCWAFARGEVAMMVNGSASRRCAKRESLHDKGLRRHAPCRMPPDTQSLCR